MTGFSNRLIGPYVPTTQKGALSGVAALSATGSVLSAVTGLDNFAAGTGSLASITTSTYNTAIGVNALAALSSGGAGGSTAVGNGALQAYNGTYGADAYGTGAAGMATSGQILAFGGGSLANVVAAGTVLAIGATALNALNRTTNAFAIGDAALFVYVGGGAAPAQHAYPPTTIGHNGGFAATSGTMTAMGQQVLQHLTIGEATAVGYLAGDTNQGFTTQACVTGVGNTYIGAFACNGDNSTDPSYVTCLGYGTTVENSGGVAIGIDHTSTGAAATGQDQIVLGTALHTVVVPGPSLVLANGNGTGLAIKNTGGSPCRVAFVDAANDLILGNVDNALAGQTQIRGGTSGLSIGVAPTDHISIYGGTRVTQASAPTLVNTTTPTLAAYGFTLAQAQALIAIANATSSALSATAGGIGIMA
jgi:hypothetical protein